MLAQRAAGCEVLDVGYAQLPNRFLLEDGRRVTGVDLSEPQLRTGYDAHIAGDIFSLRDLDGHKKYDSIVMGEFIEHVERPYDLLRYLSESIKDGGTLIASTPNPLGFPVIAFELGLSRKYFYTTEHTYYFSPRWMVRALEASGYRLISLAGVGLWPFGLWCPIAASYQVMYVATPVRESRS
jgi:2-polyprenyl-3-methyl-5-hydroxy-6-metoxy-1,4-benzoquinol methylase